MSYYPFTLFKLVKTIRIVLNDAEHAEFKAIKEKRTWYGVLVRGVSSIENFSSDEAWCKAVLDGIDDE